MNKFDNLKNISCSLNDLSDHLMLNGSLLNFSGLLHGKLGIALFFFHYARYTTNPFYNEYARYLVDIVKSKINEDCPLDYERGLAGVGSGFNYLKKYGYYDVGDDYLSEIDAKIIKVMGYESRVGLLTGFGRYLLSRHEANPVFEGSLIQLVNLLCQYIEPTQKDIPEDMLSLFCDLYLLHIENDKMKLYLSGAIDMLILDIQKDSQSSKLFTLIKLSHITSSDLCRQAINNALRIILSKSHEQFTGINEFQWLLQCKKEIEGRSYTTFNPELTSKIAEITVFYDSSNLDEMFKSVKKFSLKGGYSGLGLALLSVINSDNNSWINLL